MGPKMGPKLETLGVNTLHTCSRKEPNSKTCADKDREARSESVTFMDLEETVKRVYQLQRELMHVCE